MWLPLVALIIPVAQGLGARAAAATSVAGAMTLSLLTPIDLPLLVVLTAQGIAAGLVAGGRTSALAPLRAAFASALSGGLAFAGISLVLSQFVPVAKSFQQARDLLALLDSEIAGAVGGGLSSGLLALITTPVILRMLGVVSKAKLFALADFENPLLKQIASHTPGTWAHSLAMANMAEMAANAIRADGLLVRVGAYYHDLGKSVQPEYYIENQDGKNPHDGLAPDVSADAIFSHVTEGVKLARKHKLPEAVIEFVYTHHGNGVLEYFWHKNMAAGNPKGLSERDFCYPGVPPQRPETAILALCDAVEAASRTLKDPDNEKIRQLIRQIIFTKLDQGMLNDSGLTIPDLQRISGSLGETLRSSFHVRVKYPWQRDEEARERSAPSVPAAPVAPSPAATPAAAADPGEEVIPLAAKKGSKPAVVSDDPAWARGTAERPRMSTMPLGARRGSDDPTGSGK
jgi:putative nucleotidyltransferase with HDIG domain